MPIKITYFVHSTTKDNEKRLATGWSPGELSDLGLNQADQLKEIVSQEDFDLVFSSDLKRAIDTSEIAFANFPRFIDKRLREIDFGELEKTDKKQIETRLGQYVENAFPKGESFKEVEVRIQAFLNYLLETQQDKHIAIVAHQASQLALNVLLKGKTWLEAINEDWRKTKSWQPGWQYELQ